MYSGNYPMLPAKEPTKDGYHIDIKVRTGLVKGTNPDPKAISQATCDLKEYNIISAWNQFIGKKNVPGITSRNGGSKKRKTLKNRQK